MPNFIEEKIVSKDRIDSRVNYFTSPRNNRTLRHCASCVSRHSTRHNRVSHVYPQSDTVVANVPNQQRPFKL